MGKRLAHYSGVTGFEKHFSYVLWVIFKLSWQIKNFNFIIFPCISIFYFNKFKQEVFFTLSAYMKTNEC